MADFKLAAQPTITILDSVPSTMDAARDNLSAGRVRFDAGGNAFPSGVVARDQTAGRGQRGRTWFARPGECLCATYYFAHGLNSVEQAGQLSFVAGLAVCRALHDLCKEEVGTRVGLKWPNDILLNNKKLGGILVELAQIEVEPFGVEPFGVEPFGVEPFGVEQSGAGQSKGGQVSAAQRAYVPAQMLVALVGVGINISVMDFPPELAPFATSLKREGVKAEDNGEDNEEAIRLKLAHAVAAFLDAWGCFWQAQGLALILELWRQYDQTPGRVFETTEGTKDGLPVRGVAEGVADDGALCLRLVDGRLLNVRSASALRELSG